MPPDATALAVPLLPPLQETFVCDGVTVIADGEVTVTVCAIEHPFASVTVAVYVAAQRFVAVAVV